MKRNLAHVLRRTARVLIGLSRRLDPPWTPFDEHGSLDPARTAGFVFVGAMVDDEPR